MKTVGWLRAELAKFPDEAKCYAYEGEGNGIVVEPVSGRGRQGFIPCSEGGSDGDWQTELLPDVTPPRVIIDEHADELIVLSDFKVKP